MDRHLIKQIEENAHCQLQMVYTLYFFQLFYLNIFIINCSKERKILNQLHECVF